jgi:cytoskeletal protein RodZ
MRSKWLQTVFILIMTLALLLSACGADTEAAVQQTIDARDAQATNSISEETQDEETQDIGVSVEQTIAARDALESEAEMQTATTVSASQIAANSVSGTQTAESVSILATQVEGDNVLGTRTAEQTAVAIAANQTAAAPPILLVNLANVNLRNGPDTAYQIIGYLSEGDTVVALAKNSDGSWYNVVLPNGSTGWIADSVTIPLAVSAMSKVDVAATIPPLPTFTPTPTATATPIPSIVGLDHSLPPYFGSISLSAGFLPDPYMVSLNSGGEVDVENLGIGSNCRGYASNAPDFRLHWSGEGDELNFLFTADLSSDDTTLIINDPFGNWYCNDDLAGLNPGISFGIGESGQYDVWIGSYISGDFISGQLTITEFSIP